MEEAQGQTEFREGRVTESKNKRKTNNSLYLSAGKCVCGCPSTGLPTLVSSENRVQVGLALYTPNPRTSIASLKSTNRRHFLP